MNQERDLFSPRPTPEVVSAVSQNTQSHDCVQVRDIDSDTWMVELTAENILAHGVDVRAGSEGLQCL